MKSPATARAAGRAKWRIQDEMVSSTSDDDGNVVAFPKTAEERKALRKARQHVEQQKLVDRFVGEAGDDALFVNADGVAFADLIVNGHRETWPVRSKQFRAAYIKYIKHQAEAAAEAEDAVAVGLWHEPEEVRHQQRDRPLRDAGGRRRRHPRSPRSRRRRRRRSLRRSRRSGVARDPYHRDELVHRAEPAGAVPPQRRHARAAVPGIRHLDRQAQAVLNISAHDFVLAVAWVLAALRPTGPYPVLALIGEHGAAKTSLMRLLRSLIDPSTVPTGAIVDLAAAICSSARAIRTSWRSKIFRSCRIRCRITFAGLRLAADFVPAQLFTDTDETVLRAVRPIVMEGISNFITRADLMDRSVILAPEPLPERKTDAALMAEFERLRPGLFGALLDHLVRGVRQFPDTASRQPTADGRFRDVGRRLRARRLRASLCGQSASRN